MGDVPHSSVKEHIIYSFHGYSCVRGVRVRLGGLVGVESFGCPKLQCGFKPDGSKIRKMRNLLGAEAPGDGQGGECKKHVWEEW